MIYFHIFLKNQIFSSFTVQYYIGSKNEIIQRASKFDILLKKKIHMYFGFQNIAKWYSRQFHQANISYY